VPLFVPDATREQRFADNPFVTGEPHVRFYFGAPLVTSDQYALGTLCVIDSAPRTLQPRQIETLTALARQVVKLLEFRRNAAELRVAWMDLDAQAKRLERLQRDIEEANLELRRATDEAQTANRARTVFLANMSHDIRTPIAGVLGMADLLLDTSLDAEQRENAESIKMSAEGLLALINDILDLSKVEAGKLELDLHPVSLRDFVRELERMMGFAAAKKGLKLETAVGETVPATVLLDSHRVRQVLVNLLGNAVKFTSAGKVTLSVSATVRGSAADLTFTVADTAPLPSWHYRTRRANPRRTPIRVPASRVAILFCRPTKSRRISARRGLSKPAAGRARYRSESRRNVPPERHPD
jgi:signal transduction histidine kinase